MVNKITKILIVMIVVLSISVLSYGNTRRTENVEAFVQGLNQGAGATMMNISFSCINPEADEPILTIKALTQCLECSDCAIQMETFLGHGFLMLSDIWHVIFGSYRCNITNQLDKVVFIINSNHKLVKPMPLPKDYI